MRHAVSGRSARTQGFKSIHATRQIRMPQRTLCGASEDVSAASLGVEGGYWYAPFPEVVDGLPVLRRQGSKPWSERFWIGAAR